MYDGYMAALCPFHQDTQPSLLVYPDHYRCLACGARGRTSALLKRGLLYTYKPEANSSNFADVNPFSKWSTEYGNWINAVNTAAFVIRMRESKYLRDRGISHKDQIKLELGMLDNWYTIPIFDEDDKMIGAVARRGEDNPSRSKYVMPYGQRSDILYVPNWCLALSTTRIFLTFGIFDAITLAINNIPAMSTISGKHLDPSALDRFRKKIIIWPDKDEESEAYQLASALGWRGQVFIPDWPDDCKDVNDLFVRRKDDFYELVRRF